jgi:hypothetical protein
VIDSRSQRSTPMQNLLTFIPMNREFEPRMPSPEIGFSPIRLHSPFLRNGNASPQSRDFLATTWVGTSIRMVLVHTPARFLRRTVRQRETRGVGRQKPRAIQGSRGRTARRIRRYRYRMPAIHSRRAFSTIHCGDLPSIKEAIRGVWVRFGCWSGAQ